MKAPISRVAPIAVIVALATAAFASTATGSGNPIQRGPVDVRLASPLVFLPATSDCPAGRAHTSVTALDGQTVGSATSCIQSFAPTGPNSQVVELLLTFRLAGGVIDAAVSSAETFGDSFTTFTERWTGTVTGGSGLDAGATGTLTGGGTLTFNSDGTVAPNLEAVLDLSA